MTIFGLNIRAFASKINGYKPLKIPKKLLTLHIFYLLTRDGRFAQHFSSAAIIWLLALFIEFISRDAR